MPTTRRSRVLPTTPPELWRTVGDPHSLPRWWPKVARVEQVSGGRFTQVLQTESGRQVRADFRLTSLQRPEEVAWEQEVDGTPFERVLRAARTTVRLREVDGNSTQVELSLDQKLRGFASFGGFMVRRAARRQLDEALDALEHLTG